MRPYRAIRGLLTVAVVLSVPSLKAGPLVLQESSKITVPGSAGQIVREVAISGDHLLVATRRNFDDATGSWSEHSAYLYQRNSAAQWTLLTTLAQSGKQPNQGSQVYAVAIKDTVAALSIGPRLYIFERTSTGWPRIADLPTNGGLTDVEIDAGTIAVSRTNCAANLYRKNASGQWAMVGSTPVPAECSPFSGTDADISGTTLAVANPTAGVSSAPGAVNIFEGIPPPSAPTYVLKNGTSTDPYFGLPVAVENGTLLAGGSDISGVFSFDRIAGGSWNAGPLLQPADTYRIGWPSRIQLTGGAALIGYVGDPHRGATAGSVSVFKRAASGSYIHVARLVASDAASGTQLGRDVDIGGQTVVAASASAVYVFQLPADLAVPALLQDDFQFGNAAGWTPTAGSQFSVVPSGFSRVYRQSSVAGNAAAILGNTNWRNQSIQVDAKPIAFPTADRWFGLVVRYVDPQNYYYITARSSNVIQIKRMVNGVFQTLASAPLTVTPGRTYRLRLEAVGTWIRAYVDGSLSIQARDSSIAQGQAGLMMYQAQVEYDNAVVSPNPSLDLYVNNFQTSVVGPWTTQGTGTWALGYNGSLIYEQTSLAGAASASIGVDTGDQIVQTRAKPTTFASGTAEERWFGIMVRYQDDENYYFLAVRNNNTISLRRRVNGAVQILDTAPLTVTAGIGYTLRLEAIGNSLRGHVNGRLLVEAADTALASGTYGLAMYKTATQYDDVLVVQP